MASDLNGVERFEAAIGRFERILYGEQDTHHAGLLTQFADLSQDVQGLREDLRALKARRHNLWLWVAGYVGFLASGLFALIGVIGVVMSPEFFFWLDMPAPMALFVAIVFAGVSLLLFLGGFGWLGE